MKPVNRNNTRHKAIGMMCTLFDSKSVCIGIVEDVSVSGFRAGQVPLEFDDSDEQRTIIIHSLTGDFKIHAIPKWSRVSTYEMYKEIGFLIDDPTQEWVEFTQKMQTVACSEEDYSLFKASGM